MKPFNCPWIFYFFLLIVFMGGSNSSLAAELNLENIRKQNSFEREGRDYERLCQYDLAKESYKKAIELGRSLSPRQDYWRPVSFYVAVLQKEGNYLEAFEMMRQNSKSAPENEYFRDRTEELRNLVSFSRTGDLEAISKYIKDRRQKRQDKLLRTGIFDEFTVAAILRLYDTIGDCDAGIKFIDEVLDYLKERRKKSGDKSYEIYDRIKTVEQATACLKKGPKNNPDWRGCEFLKGYLSIREAFEQDKAEGWKGCAKAKPRQKEGGQAGEVCMGRATKALIQSDYFPW